MIQLVKDYQPRQELDYIISSEEPLSLPAILVST